MNAKFKILVKKHLPLTLRAAKAVAKQVRSAGSKLKIRRILRERGEIFVEIGSGDKPGTRGWITIDMTENCDIFWDLRDGLPFPDETLAKIYSSHFFEHLSFKETHEFLDECKRSLIPGGKFLICVPDARIYLEAYVTGKPLDSTVFLAYEPAHNCTTRIDYVNYIAYMDGEHKYMFDEENLLYILESHGFKNVRPRPFDPDLDMQERDLGSIYAEAEKS